MLEAPRKPPAQSFQTRIRRLGRISRNLPRSAALPADPAPAPVHAVAPRPLYYQRCSSIIRGLTPALAGAAAEAREAGTFPPLDSTPDGSGLFLAHSRESAGLLTRRRAISR